MDIVGKAYEFKKANPSFDVERFITWLCDLTECELMHLLSIPAEVVFKRQRRVS